MYPVVMSACVVEHSIECFCCMDNVHTKSSLFVNTTLILRSSAMNDSVKHDYQYISEDRLINFERLTTIFRNCSDDVPGRFINA